MTSQLSLLSIGYFQSALGPVETGPIARPWEPFKRIPIRLFGTNKTTKGKEGKAYGRRNITSGGNCIDTVRGCVGGRTNGGRGCFGDCYAKESLLIVGLLLVIFNVLALGFSVDLVIGYLRKA